MPSPDHLMCFTGTLTHVTQPGTTDANGDLNETTTTKTVRYWLHQFTASEIVGLENVEIGDAAVWLPADTVAGGLDQLVGDDGGGTWEFTGPPVRAMNPRTGVVSHLEVQARSIG